MWRHFLVGVERQRLAIDVINGSELLREWVDDTDGSITDLESLAVADENAWREERDGFLIYT